MKELRIDFGHDPAHFISRKLLQQDPVCTQKKYDNCFSTCPPLIPGPPPPPASLIDYRRSWCIGHTMPWQCNNTNYGPVIYGENPRLQKTKVPVAPKDATTTVVLSAVLPAIALAAIVIAVVIVVRRKRNSYKKKEVNTYNVGYLNKPQTPTWTDNDGTEAVEDGSEIFYQVDRSAALSTGLNGGVGNSRSIPDVVHSSSATLRRSGSATSQAPLLSSPEIAAHKRRMLTRTTSGGGHDAGDSDIGSPLYTRYGAANCHQPVTKKHSHEPATQGAAGGIPGGYMTYSPNTKSHPSLFSGTERPHGSGTTVRTPKTARQQSFGAADYNKPRPLRKPSGAAAVARSDSMTLNRAAGRENYRNNWENFDEVTATMRRNKGAPTNRELVLGTDSFIESFTSPEPEEATSVDQLGLPTRNPFLQGYYDYEDDDEQAETSFGPRGDNSTFMSPSQDGAGFGNHSAPSPEHPPAYNDVSTPQRTPSVSLSQMPTLDLRGRRDRISEYDSEDSVEV